MTVLEDEDSPERKLELLYGVTLPDWCVNGTDLPGVYKDIAEKTTDVSDAIDTNSLFPILMASDLPRDQLGHIWNKANRAVPGQLNTLELRIVLGLVALGQVCTVIRIANEQPHEDARLRGGSIIKPYAKVPRQNESRIDVT